MRFKIILLALFGCLFFYLGYQLIARLPSSLWIRTAGWTGLGLLFANVLWLPLVHWNRDEVPGRFTEILEWSAHLSLAVLSFLLLFCLVRDVILLPLQRLHLLNLPLYGLSGTAVILGLSAISLAIGMIEALGPPRVKTVEIPISGLHPDLDGFRILQISDLHIGSTVPSKFVERVIAASNAEKPDLIALTGDIVDGDVRTLSEDIAALSHLQSPLGTFYVTGNHEYYWGVDAILSELRKNRVTPLLNEHQVFEIKGARLLLAGVTDPTAGHYDPRRASSPEKAIQGAPTPVHLKVLLAHQPKTSIAAEKAGFDLQLSGHTHGGQFIPWIWVVKFVHQFAGGLGRLGNLQVYVNLGTGYWGPPIRLGAPSEITMLVLKPSPPRSESLQAEKP